MYGADEYISVSIINPELFRDLTNSYVEIVLGNNRVRLHFDYFENIITSTDDLFEAEYTVRIKVFPNSSVLNYILSNISNEQITLKVLHVSMDGIVYEINLIIDNDLIFFIENLNSFEYYVVVSFFVRDNISINSLSTSLQRVYFYYERATKYERDVVKFAKDKKSSYSTILEMLDKPNFTCSMSHVLNKNSQNKKIENRNRSVNNLFVQDRIAKCHEEIMSTNIALHSTGFFMLYSGKGINSNMMNAVISLPYPRKQYGILLNRDGSFFLNLPFNNSTYYYKFTSGYYGFYPQFFNRIAFVSEYLGCEQILSDIEKEEFITPNMIVQFIGQEYHVLYFHYLGYKHHERFFTNQKRNFINLIRKIGMVNTSNMSIIGVDYNKIAYKTNQDVLKLFVVFRESTSIQKTHKTIFKNISVFNMWDVFNIRHKQKDSIVQKALSFDIKLHEANVFGSGAGFFVFIHDANDELTTYFTTYKSVFNSKTFNYNPNISRDFYEINRNFFLNLHHFFHHEIEYY